MKDNRNKEIAELRKEIEELKTIKELSQEIVKDYFKAPREEFKVEIDRDFAIKTSYLSKIEDLKTLLNC